MKIIALMNQKGGVAKTTSAINLSAALSKLGKKILLIDLDPQGNATVGSGVEAVPGMKTTHELLLGTTTAQECITNNGVYGIIPTDIRLAGAEIDLVSRMARECLLRAKLQQLSGYDYIIIDCPPSLGLLTVNALVACNEVYIPVSASMFALTGLDQLVDSIERVKLLNADINVGGIFLTKFDTRKKFSHEVIDYLNNIFENSIMDTRIRVCADIDKAQVQGMDVYRSNPRARSAEDYMNLAKELISHV